MATILITGVTRGLGFDLAQEYYKQGHRLILIGRDLDRVRGLFVTKSIQPVMLFDMDFDFIINDTLNSLQVALSTFGYPECAIHCAGGGLRLSQPNLSYHEMMRLWNANFLGALAINSILIPKMTGSKGGRLIFVGSMAGTQAIGSVGYNTVKAALNAYVRTLGNALIADSILVCGVNPGDFLATDNAMSRLQINNPDFFKNNVEKRNPRGHLATSAEVIKIITYLAFHANSLFAGSMVAIDGGGSLAY